MKVPTIVRYYLYYEVGVTALNLILHRVMAAPPILPPSLLTGLIATNWPGAFASSQQPLTPQQLEVAAP